MQNTTPAPKAHVKSVEGQPYAYVVSPDWSEAGVDRPVCAGVAVKNRKLADRLVRAIEDGVAYTYRGILTDVNGKTYVDYKHNVMGRHLNADLNKLGY